MNQVQKAEHFASLHAPGNPLILYNIWDAGSAKAVLAAGAKALATGSWSVAGAQGFEDGEAIPLDWLVQITKRIVDTVDAPLSIDFEGGYAAAPADVAGHAARLIEVGAVGVNFEDRIVNGSGLYDIARQSERIGAIRRQAEALGIPFFINARTDLFLEAKDRSHHAALIEDAKARAAAYRDAGASGFFAPGLVDEDLIQELGAASELPLNIMIMEGAPSIDRLAALGVARISFGPIPFVLAMRRLTEQAKEIFDQYANPRA
ncbi:MAG: isocitrate lyase/phosphoenolpyruvate mutase family protein [Pseudomonadota bacterium]